MTVHPLWIGASGDMEFDDSEGWWVDPVTGEQVDPDENPAAIEVFPVALKTTGKVEVSRAPVDDDDVVRRADLTTGALSELLLTSPNGLHTLRLRIQDDGAADIYVDGQLWQGTEP